jgi:hypothetical protein
MTKQAWDALIPGMYICNLLGRHPRPILSVYHTKNKVGYIEVPRLGPGPNILIDRHYHHLYLIYDKPYILST